MILLLGASGYIGQAFARELRRRETSFLPLSRRALDYTRFELLFDQLRRTRPELVINAAGHAGKPDEADCEPGRMEAFQANTILPQAVLRACQLTNTPLGHVSSGSIYAGAKVWENGETRVERDLTRPEIRRAFEADPEKFRGFTELDEPNFCFRSPPCNFYSGTKALGEEAIREDANSYIWRLRMPFNEREEPGNLLARLPGLRRLHDGVNSLSHLDDCVRACLDLWENRAPFGIYNVTNPGAITTRQVLEIINQIVQPGRHLEEQVGELPGEETGALQSHCILDVTKLLRSGVKLRSVQAALEDSLANWRPVSRMAPAWPPLRREALAAVED
jgi:dTDP-4-dehydrorhamnose reductase